LGLDVPDERVRTGLDLRLEVSQSCLHSNGICAERACAVLVRSMEFGPREPAMVEVFEVGVEQEVRFCHRGTKGCGSGHFVTKNPCS
jgi:hypothetical protein